MNNTSELLSTDFEDMPKPQAFHFSAFAPEFFPSLRTESVYNNLVGPTASDNPRHNQSGLIPHKAHGKRSKVSSLKCFFANITSASKDAIDQLKNSKQYDVIGAVETHARGENAIKLSQTLEIAGWIPIQARATQSDKSEKGTQGGAMLMHKRHLQVATPVEASECGKWLEDGNLAWKHFRLSGVTTIIALTYFNHSIGFSGSNIDMIKKLNELRDGGRKHQIIIGDFNIPPEEWHSSGWLELLGVEVIALGKEVTCRTTSGTSQIDYLLVSYDIVQLISNFRIIYAVAWWPHFGIEFEVNRRAEHIKVLKRMKPLPLPDNFDDEGKKCQWDCKEEQWQSLLADAHLETKETIACELKKDPESYEHAKSLGIDEIAIQKSIQYKQWSIATEKAQLLANGNEDDIKGMNKSNNPMLGRGSMPSFAMKPLHEISSTKIVEHQAWLMPSNIAMAGNDLFSNLWATIAGLLRYIAKSVRVDSNCTQQSNKELHKAVRMYFGFTTYLVEAATSPLRPSLDKLNLKHDRWLEILSWPFRFTYHQLEAFASEARKLGQTFNSLAKANTRKEFEEKIDESLEKGDGWNHRYAKDSLAFPNYAVINPLNGDHITHPQDVLSIHTKTWSNQWLAGKGIEKRVQEATAALINDARELPPIRKVYPPISIRNAARKFKRTASIGSDNWTLTR